MKSNANIYLPLLFKHTSNSQSKIFVKTAKQLIKGRLKSKEHILYMITRDLYEEDSISTLPSDDPRILGRTLLRRDPEKTASLRMHKKIKKIKKGKKI